MDENPEIRRGKRDSQEGGDIMSEVRKKKKAWKGGWGESFTGRCKNKIERLKNDEDLKRRRVNMIYRKGEK